MVTRITVPSEMVRTPEQILDGFYIQGPTVWVACWNCGGTGRYPSSMTPPGQCRLYCWKQRTLETFGKLPTPVATFVKKAQAADRAAYRAKVRWEQAAPEREALAAVRRYAEEAAERERMAKAEAEAARRAISQWVGVEGERIEREVVVTRVISYKATSYGRHELVTRYVVHFRTAAQELLVWFADHPPAEEGVALTIRGTVKGHDLYQGEKQTVLSRVKAIQ